MFFNSEKSSKKKFFLKITNFYNYLNYMKYLVKEKYPILDESDNLERDTVYTKLNDLMEELESEIFDYKEEKISFDEFKESFDKFKTKYMYIEMDFPVLDGFETSITPMATGMIGPGTSVTTTTSSFSRILK